MVWDRKIADDSPATCVAKQLRGSESFRFEGAQRAVSVMSGSGGHRLLLCSIPLLLLSSLSISLHLSLYLSTSLSLSLRKLIKESQKIPTP